MSDLKFYAINLLLLIACLTWLAIQKKRNPSDTTQYWRPKPAPKPGPAPWDRPAAIPASLSPSTPKSTTTSSTPTTQPPANTPPVFLPDPIIRPAYRPSDQPWGTSSTRYTDPTVPVSGHWRKGKSGKLYWVRSHKRRPS